VTLVATKPEIKNRPDNRRRLTLVQSEFGAGNNINCSGCGAYIAYTPSTRSQNAMYCNAMCSRNPPIYAAEVRDSRMVAIMLACGAEAAYLARLLGIARENVRQIVNRRLGKTS
jgi:hypothetical protein